MANERLGQQVEVTFHIQEGSFYNCIMPGFAPFLYIFSSQLKIQILKYYLADFFVHGGGVMVLSENMNLSGARSQYYPCYYYDVYYHQLLLS